MTQKSVLQTDDTVAHKIEYPHNLLRNLAKEGALTEYILGNGLIIDTVSVIYNTTCTVFLFHRQNMEIILTERFKAEIIGSLKRVKNFLSIKATYGRYYCVTFA